MRLLVLPTVFALALPLPLRGQGNSPPPPPPSPPMLVVSGRGEVRLKPDRAILTLAVETRAKTAAEAGTDNARRQTDVLDSLHKVGIAADAIATTSYNIQQDWRPDPQTHESKPVGYIVSSQIAVHVYDLTRLGRVIDAALGAGANRVDGLRFGASGDEQAQLAALDSAVKQAARRAGVMAQAAGGSVGALLELSTEPYTPVPLPGTEMAFSARAATTPIVPGDLTVVATVLARWQFVPRNK